MMHIPKIRTGGATRRRRSYRLAFVFNVILFVAAAGNAMPGQDSTAPDNSNTPPAAQPEPSQHEKAKEELHQEEKQRILGVVPNFNTTDNQDAAPLSTGQKYSLAFRGAIDPFQFAAAALDAGYSQALNDFPGYGQGAKGYGKRFGAAYADQFSGSIWGDAVLPSLLREDPRYFRRGEGTTSHRLFYALAASFWTKNDNGTRGPNYANVAGNVIAGGFSNLYYPRADRGWALTFQRAATVTIESAFGAVFLEFWPDVSQKVFHRSGD
jgi:hypothetical protein